MQSGGFQKIAFYLTNQYHKKASRLSPYYHDKIVDFFYNTFSLLTPTNSGVKLSALFTEFRIRTFWGGGLLTQSCLYLKIQKIKFLF